MKQHEKDPVVDSLPKEWLSEQKAIAVEAMAVLKRHYPGWAWGIEWTDIVGKEVMSALIVRITDVPTDAVYIIQHKDIDRDRLECVMRAGGQLLEALGLSRTKYRHDEVHGLARTASGLIVPDHAAVPANNPGYEKFKREFTLVQDRK